MVASVSGVSSASGGVQYYENDGYYADGDVEHQQASVWHGRGAEELGLAGETVDAAQFKAVLDGYVPDTDRRLGRVIDGVHKHQPGIDITLNAPKSVSLAALLGNNKAVAKAHREAVASTLAWVESR